MFKHWSAFILITGIFVCWQSVAQAQQPFSDTTSATRDFAEYIRTVQLINNDVLAVGRISDSLNTGQLEVLFQYLDPDPQRHFIVKGSLPGQHFATNAFVLPWGVGVTGVFSSSFAYPTQGFLMLYDMFSDTVYVSYYTGSNVLLPFKLSDGCYIDQKLYLVGEQPMSAALNAMDETVLLIADFNGNVLQTRRMGQLGATQGGGRIKIGSSNRLMIGYYQITFQPVLKHQIRIDEVSLDGTLQRFHLSADSLLLFGPYDFIRTHDGGLAYIGLNFIEQQAYLAKLNPQWQTRPVWAYTMGDTTHSFVPNALVEDSSGHFLMAGYNKKDSTIGGTTYYKQQAKLAKVNRYGELVWDRQFLPFDTLSNQRATFNDIRITNSGYALAGSVYDYPQTLAKARYAWILQIDSFGCLIPGCAVSVAETKMNQVSLKVWPNPASELLYVNYKSNQPQKITELRLSDMQGRIRFQNKSAEPEVQYILPVHALEAGVYVLQVVQNGRLVAFEKVMVGR